TGFTPRRATRGRDLTSHRRLAKLIRRPSHTVRTATSPGWLLTDSLDTWSQHRRLTDRPSRRAAAGGTMATQAMPPGPLPHDSTAMPSSATGTPLSLEELAQSLEIDLRPGRDVEVDQDRVLLVANKLASLTEGSTAPAKWDDPWFWNVESPPSDRSQYFAVGNAINFRFWDVSTGSLRTARGFIGGVECRGSMYMWRCMRRCIDSALFPILQADFLANLTQRQFDDIFADDAGRNQLDIAGEERITNLRDLGRQLGRDWNGN